MNARECGNKEDFKQNGGLIFVEYNEFQRYFELLITNIYIFTIRNNMLKLSLAHVVSAFENTL